MATIISGTDGITTTTIDVSGDLDVTGRVTFDGVIVQDNAPAGTLVINTDGSVDIGSGQFYKDAVGNLGLGVTPSAWASNYKAFESAGGALYQANNNQISVVQNAYNNGTNWIYKNSAQASLQIQAAGSHQWFTAPSGTAGDPITFTQAMTLTQAGNVGINTATPTAFGDFRYVDLVGASVNQGGVFMTSVSDRSVVGRISTTNVGTTVANDTNHPVLFDVNGSERARITPSGNLLVGTTTDGLVGLTSKVISAADGPNKYALGLYSTDPDFGTSIRFLNNNNTAGAVISVGASNDPIIGLKISSDANPTYFFTGGIEHARITSAGGFKVTTSDVYPVTGSGGKSHEFSQDATATAAFHASHRGVSDPHGYFFRFTAANPNNAVSYVFTAADNASANIYTIFSNGTVSARSDRKLKTNIVDASPKLDDLMALKVRNYEWITNTDGTKEIGFIAQELQEVFPNLVHSNPDKDSDGHETGEETLSIKHSALVPILVKALQEAKQQIDELRAEVNALKGV